MPYIRQEPDIPPSAYCSYNSLEIWVEDRHSHDSVCTFTCNASEPELFLQTAQELATGNTIMHLKGKFGIEYSGAEYRAPGVDEQNAHVFISFDVHPKANINTERISRFLDLVAQSIDLVGYTAQPNSFLSRLAAQEAQYEALVKAYLSGAPVNDLATRYNMAPDQIYQVMRRYRWAANIERLRGAKVFPFPGKG